MCEVDPKGVERGGGGRVQCMTPSQLRKVLTARGWCLQLEVSPSLEMTEIRLLSSRRTFC